jgi:hypothetical protein
MEDIPRGHSKRKTEARWEAAKEEAGVELVVDAPAVCSSVGQPRPPGCR